MKLRVEHEDGRHEVVTLRGTFTVVHGRNLDRLVGEDIEFFFTKDGRYDGWGAAVRLEEPEADRLIDSTEEGRSVEG